MTPLEKQMQFENDLDTVLQEIANTLISKNRKYGDSALSPVRIFSKAATDEQINVRIDDKLSRIATSAPDDTEDAEFDLLGYLILKYIHRLRQANEAKRAKVTT